MDRSLEEMKQIAHALWDEGGRLRTNLSASLVMSPQNWHVEAAEQRIAAWDSAAARYFDAAIAPACDPPSAVQGEELPELDVTDDDKRNAYIALQYVGTDGTELLGATQRVFCRERHLRTALAEIRRLKWDLEVEKALVETFTLPKEFAVAELYYNESGDQTDYGRVIDAVMQGFVSACENRYPSDHPHDLIYDSDGDIDEAIHFVASGIMNRACEAAEQSLSTSRADALKEAADIAFAPNFPSAPEGSNQQAFNAALGEYRNRILARMEKAS